MNGAHNLASDQVRYKRLLYFHFSDKCALA